MKTDTAQLIGTDVSTSFEPETTNTAANVKKDLSAAGTVVSTKETYNIDGQSLTIDWTKGDAKKLFDATIKQNHANLTADGAKDIAEKLTELFNNEIKAQGLQGEVEIKIDGTGAVTMKSLSTAENAAIGYVGSDAATADQVKTVGTFFFGAGDGKSNVVTPTMKFNNTITANDKFTMTINGTTVEGAGFAAARGDDMETVKADLETAIQTAVGAYNTAMGYTNAHEEFVNSTKFSVEVDKRDRKSVV